MEAWTKRTLKEIEALEWDVEITNKEVETINKGSEYCELYNKSEGSINDNDWVIYFSKWEGPKRKAKLYKLGIPLEDMFHLDITKTTIDFNNPIA